MWICTTCGSQGKPKKVIKGNLLIEIILWCFFLLPGLFYTLWRLSTREKVCSKCSSRNIVPIDSPIGKKLLTQFNGEK